MFLTIHWLLSIELPDWYGIISFSVDRYLNQQIPLPMIIVSDWLRKTETVILSTQIQSFRGPMASGRSCVRHRIIEKINWENMLLSLNSVQSKCWTINMYQFVQHCPPVWLCWKSGQLLQVGQLLLTPGQMKMLTCQDSDLIQSLSCKPCTGIVKCLLRFFFIVDNRVGQ